MICRDRRLIFIHIPKCGGTSVEDLLWPGPRSEADLWMGFTRPHGNPYATGGLQHLTARLVREVVGADLFDSCFTFSIVRHPLDRVVSQYRYMGRRPDLRAYAGMPEGASFETYLDLIAQREHVQWAPQSAFLFDERGDAMLDAVWRLEDLAVDATPLLRAIGLPGHALPRANAAPGARPAVSTEAAARVRSVYAEDFERLGYDDGRAS